MVSCLSGVCGLFRGSLVVGGRVGARGGGGGHGGGVSWFSCRQSSFVAGQVIRRILAALVGFWFVGSSPTMVGCVGALELGIPVPVHGLRAPQVRVGKTT